MDGDHLSTRLTLFGPWAVAAVAVAAAVAGLVLRASSERLASAAGEVYLADVWISVVLPPIGAYLWSRTRARLLAGILLSTALMGVGSVAALYALRRSLDGDEGWIVATGSWLGTWTWSPYLLLIAVVPLLVPDGRPASRRWSRLVVAGLVAVGVIAVLASLTPGPVEPHSQITNPLGIRAATWLPAFGEGLIGATVVTFLLAGILNVGMRWRNAPTAQDRRRVGVFVAAIVLLAVTVLGADALPYPWIDLAPAFGFTVVVVVLVTSVVMSELAEETNRARHRMITAREEERFRLHHDLHDGLGPELAGLALRLNAIGTTVEDHAIKNQLAGAEEALRRAVVEVRRIVDDLRPSALDQLGLERALRQRAADLTDASSIVFEVRASGIEVGVVPLPPAVEVAAYRIACEAMTNVVRHAGAGRCTVHLRRTESVLTVDVEDDGVGMAEQRPSGVGHRSMRVRVEELGGHLRWGAGIDGAGLRVAATLPLVTK